MALSFRELFFSSEQAKWAGIAILCAIIAICLSILFNNTELRIDERLSLIAVVILFSIPAVFISLFELNCISTKNTKNEWCGYWGWVIFAIIGIQCILIIISSLMSMLVYNEASAKIISHSEENKVDSENANKIAKEMINVPNRESQGAPESNEKGMDIRSNNNDGSQQLGGYNTNEYMGLLNNNSEIIEGFNGEEFSSY
jgi:hypothetical protein